MLRSFRLGEADRVLDTDAGARRLGEVALVPHSSPISASGILFYNTLSTIVLAVYSPVIKSDPWSVFKSVLANPLIISVIVAAPFAYVRVRSTCW